MHGKRNPQVFRGKKLMISVTVDPDHVYAIDELADAKRTSRAQLFREAIALYLAVNAPRSTVIEDKAA